jgi:hypothetical protein
MDSCISFFIVMLSDQLQIKARQYQKKKKKKKKSYIKCFHWSEAYRSICLSMYHHSLYRNNLIFATSKFLDHSEGGFIMYVREGLKNNYKYNKGGYLYVCIRLKKDRLMLVARSKFI